MPTWLHGVLDYAAGIIVLFAPEIFGFSNIGGAAVNVVRIIGITLIVYALLTDYAPGAIRAIPMAAHLTFDFLAGLFLALSPWSLGFSILTSKIWLPHVVIGISMMVIVLVSESFSVTHHHRRAVHA